MNSESDRMRYLRHLQRNEDGIDKGYEDMPKWLANLIAKIKTWFKSKDTTVPTNPPTDPPVDPPPSSTAYTVTKGKTERATLKTPCRVEFDITGMKPTSPDVEAHLAGGVVSGTSWDGGNPKPNKEVFAFSAKDYKLKCNGFGEKGFYEPAATWDPTKTYHFCVVIGRGEVVETISLDGKSVASAGVALTIPDTIDVFYGWPPEKRNGAEGARLTNIIVKSDTQ